MRKTARIQGKINTSLLFLWIGANARAERRRSISATPSLLLFI